MSDAFPIIPPAFGQRAGPPALRLLTACPVFRGVPVMLPDGGQVQLVPGLCSGAVQHGAAMVHLVLVPGDARSLDLGLTHGGTPVQARVRVPDM